MIAPSSPGQPTEAHAIRPSGCAISTTGTAASPPSASPASETVRPTHTRAGICACGAITVSAWTSPTSSPLCGRGYTDIEHGLHAEQILERHGDPTRGGATRHARDHAEIALAEAVVDEPPSPREPHVVGRVAEPTVVGDRAFDRWPDRCDHRREQRGEEAPVSGADRVCVTGCAQDREPAIPLQRRAVVGEHGARSRRRLLFGDLAASPSPREIRKQPNADR